MFSQSSANRNERVNSHSVVSKRDEVRSKRKYPGDRGKRPAAFYDRHDASRRERLPVPRCDFMFRGRVSTLVSRHGNPERLYCSLLRPRSYNGGNFTISLLSAGLAALELAPPYSARCRRCCS